MQNEDVEWNIRTYYWYKAFQEPLLWGPILVTSIMHLGHMSLEEIYFMEAVAVLGFIVFEVLAGALADLIGRKRSVSMGCVLLFVSISWFVCMTSPVDAWGANIVWMVGASLCSGADDALLYDSLKEHGREHEYQKIHGRSLGNRFLLLSLGSLAAGWTAEIDLRLPLYLSIPGFAVATIAAFRFREITPIRQHSVIAIARLVKVSVLFTINHKAVKWIVGFGVLISVTSKIWFFTYNPYFELVGLDIRYYGVLFALMNGVAWLASRYVHVAMRRFGEHSILITIILMLGIPILAMGLFPSVFMVSMILVQNIVRGFSPPFVSTFLNRHLDSQNRATVISIQSAVNGLSSFCGLTLFGLIIGSWALTTGLQILGLAVLVCGGLLMYGYKRIF